MDKSPDFFEPINEYEIFRPSFAELSETDFEEDKDNIIFDKLDNQYKVKDTAQNEAVILCAGSINYSRTIEKKYTFREDYHYKTIFKYVEKLFHEGDISIAGLNFISTNLYPSSGMMKTPKGMRASFVNSKPQFLNAIKYSGINIIASSSAYNMDLGLKALLDTKQNIEKEGLLQIGIDDKGYKIVGVNGISIAIISVTIIGDEMNCLTEEGKNKYLNIYNKVNLDNQIKEAKKEGAEFILVYVNNDKLTLEASEKCYKEKGVEIAELGADIVFFTNKKYIGNIIEHVTKEKRKVKIFTSLGGLNKQYLNNNDDNASVVIKIKLTKKNDGGFYIDTNYIPCVKYDYYKGCPLTVVPTISYYNGGIKNEKARFVNLKIRDILKGEIKKDQKKIISGHKYNRPQLTIAEICDILELPITRKLKKEIDINKKINFISERKASLKKGCLAVLEDIDDKPDIYIPSVATIESAVECGACAVIASKNYEELPTLIVDNPNVAYIKIMENIRSKYNPLTVTVTGTVGKTTTKDLIGNILDTQYNTLYVNGNYNTGRTAGEVIQKLTKNTQAYVQEMHEASVNSSYVITKMCNADAALITNLSIAHLDQIKDMETLIAENFKIAQVIKEGGPLFLNYDCKILSSQRPDCRVISYSSYNENCDYYAKDIEVLSDRIKFKIFDKDGSYDALMFMQGVHNVNNAVGAFAVGRWAGIPAEKIIGAISRFRTSGIRQNLIKHKGYDIIIDSYSCTPLSMRTAFDAFTKMEKQEGKRKIGVIGDINGLGERNNELHYEIGIDISKETDVDMFFCFGTFAENLYNGIKENTNNVAYYKDRDSFNKALSNYVKAGDMILFKASHPIGLEETPKKIFGLEL